jgi:cardiolipin synthase
MQTNVLRIQDLANPAGALTALRLVLAIAFPFLAHDPQIALGTYLVAVATDIGDGAVARRMNQASHTGAVLDGWVDKILHINGAWSLTLHGYMPAWWMWMWFSREIIQWGMVMTIIGDFRTGRVRIQETSFWGRLTAVSLFSAFCCTILGTESLALPLSILTCLSGLIAALGYLRRHLEDRRRFD